MSSSSEIDGSSLGPRMTGRSDTSPILQPANAFREAGPNIRICRDPGGPGWSGVWVPASLSSVVSVSGKVERRAAREVVAAYYEAEFGELVARVGEAVDRYRAG